jgi:DNA-binding CsgD family transcriptional regulator
MSNPVPPSSDSLPGAALPALAAAADALAVGLLLLTARGRLLHANAAGMGLLAAGHWLRLGADGHVLAGPDALAARALQQALARASATAVADADRRQWLRAPDCLGSAASASLVRLDAQRAGDTPVLLMSVSDPAVPRDLSPYAEEHALTAAETRVLEVLARGLDQRQAAAALGVSLATLRSHLAALRRKTSNGRLSTLLQSVARLPPVHRA